MAQFSHLVRSWTRKMAYFRAGALSQYLMFQYSGCWCMRCVLPVREGAKLFLLSTVYISITKSRNQRKKPQDETRWLWSHFCSVRHNHGYLSKTPSSHPAVESMKNSAWWVGHINPFRMSTNKLDPFPTILGQYLCQMRINLRSSGTWVNIR